MPKLQTTHWITIALYILAIFLIAFNIFNKAKGTENMVLEFSGWIMMIIASVVMIFSNVKKVKSKEES